METAEGQVDDKQYGEAARKAFVAHTEDLGRIEEALTKAAASPGRRAPAQLKDILKRVATALHEAEQVLEDHANGTTKVADDVLLAAAQTLRAAREVIQSLVLLEAVRPLRT
jgi:flagellar hook-basal body complex protein FliE